MDVMPYGGGEFWEPSYKILQNLKLFEHRGASNHKGLLAMPLCNPTFKTK